MDITEKLKSNPFYGKKYVVLGRVSISDYTPELEECFQFLGAVKRKQLSSKIDFAFIADSPGMKSMEKIENMQENGSAIKRIPYFKAIKIAKFVNKYQLFHNYEDEYSEERLLDFIEDIVCNATKDCNLELSGLFLNDQYYKQSLEYHLKETEIEDNTERKFIAYLVIAVVLFLIWALDAWCIFLIIGLFSAFPALMGKFLGMSIRSFLK